MILKTQIFIISISLLSFFISCSSSVDEPIENMYRDLSKVPDWHETRLPEWNQKVQKDKTTKYKTGLYEVNKRRDIDLCKKYAVMNMISGVANEISSAVIATRTSTESQSGTEGFEADRAVEGEIATMAKTVVSGVETVDFFWEKFKKEGSETDTIIRCYVLGKIATKHFNTLVKNVLDKLKGRDNKKKSQLEKLNKVQEKELDSK